MKTPLKAACLAVVAAALLAMPARAGDRELEVIFVNMTPDDLSSDDSRSCVKRFESKLKKDYTNVVRFGETKTRKRAKQTKGEPLLGWPAKSFAAVKKNGDNWVDTVVLVDCRPQTKTLDIVVSPPSGGLAKIRVRGVTLDKKLTDSVMTAVMRRAWVGFSP